MKLGCVRFVIIVSAFLLSGLPSIVMQFGAWGIMIGERGESESIVEVAKAAFMGTEPCHRCEIVEERVGKEQNRNMDIWNMNELRLVNLRGETVASPLRVATRPILVLIEKMEILDGRSEGLPTPPPRRV